MPSAMRRVGHAISIANVWACGVGTAQHEWLLAGGAAFGAVVVWGLSEGWTRWRPDA